ncbi:dodecin [Phenylobacterium kunshanense]|uniref:Dodecin flavoprotein n=1 Tax=Phenylobacterium kunshanense TaxID=1445034 RepID=A0A328BG01_9CAUL|nr:dodecin [Phenylobacterium kunshanense]RAK64816.1 dodecin flavoprotein [Phenylobacterium kunshanense]
MTKDQTYGVSEIVGTSQTSIDDAIRQAIAKASENRRQIRWFEVIETRGHVEDGKVAHFQVAVKLGYALED